MNHKCDFKVCHQHTSFVDEILKCSAVIMFFAAVLFSVHLFELVSLGGMSSQAQVLGISTSTSSK